MLMCVHENCTCPQHRLLNHLEISHNEEAKLILQQIGKFWELNDASGSTLLHYTAKYKNSEMVQHLIETGCKVDAQDNSGMTPLMLAIEAESVEAVDILLKNGADIYVVVNSDGKSSLEQAFDYRLLKSPIVPLKQDSHSILEMIFDKLNTDFLKDTEGLKELLLKANNALKLAIVAFGNVELAEFMLGNCSNIVDFHDPKWGYTALHCAVMLAQLENVKILLEHGANVDELDRGPYTDNSGIHALWYFRMENSVFYYYAFNLENSDKQSEILKSMLRRSENFHTSGKNGFTDLENLLMTGNKETVKTVLLSGINVEACMKQQNRTILALLILNRKLKELDLLDDLNIKPDVNEIGPVGVTPLMIAASTGCLKKVDFLLQRGANVNLVSLYETTALSCCSPKQDYDEEDKFKVIELLLRYGANAQHPSCVRLFPTNSLSLHVKVFIAHLAVLDSLEQPTLTDLFREKINSKTMFKDYFDLCTRQVGEMKRFKLNGRVTLFKILTEKEDAAVASYACNRELMTDFSAAIENFSPIESYYLNILKRRFMTLSNDAKLLEKVIPVMEVLTGLCGDIYRAIIRQIIDYLDRQDLHALCLIINVV